MNPFYARRRYIPESSIPKFLFFNCRESFWQALMLNQPIEVALNFLGEPVDA